MPLVSVIVPVYNAEKYIPQCVDSILGQTLRDIELILVNDCSKDNSLELLNDYARRDPRVKVIDLPQNGGVANARNVALTAAQGEFTAFVDSDDWMDADRYETMYNLAKEYDVDAVMDGYVVCDDAGHTKATCPLTKELQIIPGRQMINEMFFGSISANAPWHGIYKSAIVKALRFQHIRGEDIVFNFDYYARAARVCLLPSSSYHYRQLATSLSRGYVPPESIFSLRGVEACAAYLKNNDELRRLVPDFDFIANVHLLNEYAIVAYNTGEKDCRETYAERREYLSRIASSNYFRSAFENKIAIARIDKSRRRLLSLLYWQLVDLVTLYMYLRSKRKKIKSFILGR